MKLKTLYYINKNKQNRNGYCIISCRLTFNKKRKVFSTGLLIKPNHWNNKKQCAEPPEPDAKTINTQLSLIKTKLSQAFLFLEVNGTSFNVNDIYQQYIGKIPKREFGVIEVFNLYIKRINKLVGIEIKQVTFSKYVESERHLQSFIKHKYHKTDIKINSLKSSFLDHYEYYLKTEKKLQQSTINKAIQRFRKVIKYAISEDYLDKDPFMLYKAKRVKKPVLFLTAVQLKKLEDTDFDIPRIQSVKDMFVFCCYTGLGFSEMKNLKKEHINTEFDGNLWITVNRSKTSKSYKVPLLPMANAIMNKYNNDDSEYVFPKQISNSNFNAYLKEIAHIVGIKINLTHHIARKTFASTVLLYNNVPIEIVSKLLGHSKIQTTQESYGKIVQKSISDEISRLNDKLNI